MSSFVIDRYKSIRSDFSLLGFSTGGTQWKRMQLIENNTWKSYFCGLYMYTCTVGLFSWGDWCIMFWGLLSMGQMALSLAPGEEPIQDPSQGSNPCIEMNCWQCLSSKFIRGAMVQHADISASLFLIKKMNIYCIAAWRLNFPLVLVLSGLLKLSCTQDLYRLERILPTKKSPNKVCKSWSLCNYLVLWWRGLK